MLKKIELRHQKRVEAVKAVQREEAPKVVARVMKIPLNTLYDWLARYRNGGWHSGTTWSPAGMTPVVDEYRGKFGINCISAASAKGLLRFKLFTGKMNSAHFIDSLTGLYADAGKSVYVVVDRAQYHRSNEVKKFLKKQNGRIRLFYLPAYSPELNPDEQVWNNAKNRLGRICVENKNHMKKVVLKTLRSMKKKTSLILSFFKLETTQYAAM